jgi:hypothetical protein
MQHNPMNKTSRYDGCQMSLFAVCSTNLVILRLAFVFLKLHFIVLKSLGTFCAYQQGLSNAPLASCSYALKEKLLKLKVSLETRFHEILKGKWQKGVGIYG